MSESGPRAIRVFISSTFRDMQAEREELIKRVFPRLRKLCESRGVAFDEVDLRWGVTEEEAAEGKVLPICLAEIDRCRPYFIGLLGERYGWRPDEIPPGLAESEPWLASRKGCSVTELEVLHGVLNDPAAAGHSYFYFRDPAFVDRLPPGVHKVDFRSENAASARLQAELKERIRSSGCPVREVFRDARELGEWVFEDFRALIDRLYPSESAPDPFERESAAQGAFAARRLRVYVGRDADFDRLDAHTDGDGPPLTVLGTSGLGKSALLANWARRRRESRPDELVLAHFIGATEESTDWKSMLRRIMFELKRARELPDEVPDESDAVRVAFPHFLGKAAARGGIVLLIDGLDQLEDRDQAPDLTWLPRELPAGVRLVLSALPGRALDEITRRSWPSFEVEPLGVEDRLKVIEDHLAQYRKALGRERALRLAEAEPCANPLYLRALLEELRVFGTHELLDDRIGHYLEAPDPPALFEKVLERFEADYEGERPGLVGEAMSLLWAARQGLSEGELLEVLGGGSLLPRAGWSPLYLAAEASLVSRSGLLGFFHDHLRRAVANRYLRGEPDRRAAHKRLAEYFARRDEGPRRTAELPWQLARAGEWDWLAGLLAQPGFLAGAWENDAYDVQRHWAEVEASSSHRMTEAYGEVLADPAAHIEHLKPIAFLLGRAGKHEHAYKLWRALAEHHERTGETDLRIAALGNMAGMDMEMGRLDEALEVFEDLENVCRERKDLVQLKATVSNAGVVLMRQGRYKDAMKHFERQRRLAEELGDRHDLGICLGNMAHVSLKRERFEEAAGFVAEQERLARESGDPMLLAASLTEKGVLLQRAEDLDGAVRAFEGAKELARRHGELPAVLLALGSLARLHIAADRLDEAEAVLEEADALGAEAPEPRALANAAESRALLCERRKRFGEGVHALRRAQDIYRSTAEWVQLGATLLKEAELLEKTGDRGKALERIEEAVPLLRARDSDEGFLDARVSQIRLLLDIGRYEEAAAAATEVCGILSAHGDNDRLAAALPLHIAAEVGRGHFDMAESLIDKRAALYRELGDERALQANEDLRAAVARDREASREGKAPSESAPELCKKARRATREGRREEALELLRAAVEADPEHRFAWSGLGSCLLALGKPGEAADALVRARELSPDDFQTLELLGKAQARAGRLSEAREALEACRRIDPNGPKTKRLGELISSLEKGS